MNLKALLKPKKHIICLIDVPVRSSGVWCADVDIDTV